MADFATLSDLKSIVRIHHRLSPMLQLYNPDAALPWLSAPGLFLSRKGELEFLSSFRIYVRLLIGTAPFGEPFCFSAVRAYMRYMSRYDYERVAKIYPAGTILETNAYGVIRHVGIATGYGTVIHSSGRYGQVLETSEKLFSRGQPIRTIPHNSKESGTRLVVRARSKIGQRYGVLTRNCEHFVSWVISGEARSGQLGPLDLRRI